MIIYRFSGIASGLNEQTVNGGPAVESRWTIGRWFLDWPALAGYSEYEKKCVELPGCCRIVQGWAPELVEGILVKGAM